MAYIESDAQILSPKMCKHCKQPLYVYKSTDMTINPSPSVSVSRVVLVCPLCGTRFEPLEVSKGMISYA